MLRQAPNLYENIFFMLLKGNQSFLFNIALICNFFSIKETVLGDE